MVSLDFSFFLFSLIFARLQSIDIAVFDQPLNEKALFKPLKEKFFKYFFRIKSNINTKNFQHQGAQFKQFTNKRFEAMADINKILGFSAAISGFHVYCEVWNPYENEELTCPSKN